MKRSIVITTFLLFAITICTSAMETPLLSTVVPQANAIVPIHLLYYFYPLEADNGFIKQCITSLAYNQEGCQEHQPKIVIVNSVAAYAILVDVYQHFTELGYTIPAKKRSNAPLAESRALNKKKGWENMGTILSSADTYITNVAGEKFLIIVYHKDAFQQKELLDFNHISKLNLPTQFTVISAEEQDQLMEAIADFYETNQLPASKRLETMATNFAHIFNKATQYILRFFLAGHGDILDDIPLEFQKAPTQKVAGITGASIAQFLMAINTLPTTDLVLVSTCFAGGINTKRIAEFLETNCQERKFDTVCIPPFDRMLIGDEAIPKNPPLYQATSSLSDVFNANYKAVAYLSRTAKQFKLLTKNKEALLFDLSKTAINSRERGLTTSSFVLIQEYEKEHNCELISYLAHEAAKNNNPILFLQIFRNFPDRLNPDLFIECLRLLADQGNLMEIKWFLAAYTGPIRLEQRTLILELAKRNTTPK